MGRCYGDFSLGFKGKLSILEHIFFGLLCSHTGIHAQILAGEDTLEVVGRELSHRFIFARIAGKELRLRPLEVLPIMCTGNPQFSSQGTSQDRSRRAVRQGKGCHLAFILDHPTQSYQKIRSDKITIRGHHPEKVDLGPHRVSSLELLSLATR